MPDADAPPGPAPGPAPLADLLGAHRALNTFSAAVRQDPAAAALLAAPDPARSLVVLAPCNAVLGALPRKPWENPRDYDALGPAAYDGAVGRCRANSNLRRLADAHIILLPAATAGSASWASGPAAAAPSRAGRDLWWEESPPHGTRVIMPDGVQVERVASKAANGELWILNGVLNYL